MITYKIKLSNCATIEATQNTTIVKHKLYYAETASIYNHKTKNTTIVKYHLN